jgi:tRNA dimethylallyltransferase
VDQQNPQRLMHCIEVCRASGKTYSEFRKKGKPNQGGQRTDMDIEYVLVERPREELYERINLRVDKMLEEGLLEEARRAFELLNIPLDGEVAFDYATLPNSVNTVGYKELLHYFRGEWTLERAVEMIKQNSRHYAKRQITWWRSQFKKQDL